MTMESNPETSRPLQANEEELELENTTNLTANVAAASEREIESKDSIL
jgi:hypothetical protein